MHDPSLYRTGGIALATGALFVALGVALHPPQPMTLAQARALDPGLWSMVHWVLAAGVVLAVGGLVALGRHLHRSGAAGAASLGAAAVVIGGALFAVVATAEAVAYPMLIEAAAAGGGQAVAAEHAFLAANSLVLGLALGAGPIFWAGVAVYGIAMLRDAGFPKWLAYAGIAIGLVLAASGFLVANIMAVTALSMLGAVWLAGVGILFIGRAPAPVAAAGVPGSV